MTGMLGTALCTAVRELHLHSIAALCRIRAITTKWGAVRRLTGAPGGRNNIENPDAGRLSGFEPGQLRPAQRAGHQLLLG